MTANPQRLAQCDHEGCTAEFRIERGEEAVRALEAADWSFRPGYDGEYYYDGEVFCPAHRPKREYILRIVRDEDWLYMKPHPYRVGMGQPFETLVRLLINESYDPNMTVEIVSERDL